MSGRKLVFLLLNSLKPDQLIHIITKQLLTDSSGTLSPSVSATTVAILKDDLSVG